jgi:death-on-curing family protein
MELTANHRVFSATRNGWVAAGDLQAGEALQAQEGAVRVRSVHASERGLASVFNLEVFARHEFFVGEAGVRAHNGYSSVARGAAELGGFARGVTAAEVRALNSRFGGMTTLNGSVESVLAQASRYDGFYNKAASVIRSIAGNHLFDNGNKRTANAVYDLLRSRNGITTGASSAEVRRIINDVATGVRTEIDDIARALRGF